MMGRSKKPPTKTVRVHTDVAFLIDVCAAADGVGRDVPGWLSDLLRPLLQEKALHVQDKLRPKATEPKPRPKPKP